MRHYKKKTDRGTMSLDIMKRAANEVINGEKKLCQAARDHNICRNSLKRFIARYNKEPNNVTFGYLPTRKIFTADQEKSLSDYLLMVAQMFYGLGPKDVRRLAYDCAIKFAITVPDSWQKNKMAGKDWMTAFLKRNRSLSIRKPEATSLSRATSFNRSNVHDFFNKLAQVMDKYTFTASSVWNIDETGVSTVLKPSKIVAAKGKRNVGSVTSGERGTNVTVIVAISATGSHIPPMFIFPRKNYHDHFVRDGPPDCIGKANPSGWVTDEEYYCFIQHFIRHVRPSKDTPILLLLDNHSSHLCVKTLDLAKQNGIVMLSFPPHCTHKLQPLDVSVFGSFKIHLSRAQDSWMRNNAGKTMTIYDIPSLVRTALPIALSPVNIIKGFKASGIIPFNRDIFTDADYAPSNVTDRISAFDNTENIPPVNVITDPEQTQINQSNIMQQSREISPQPCTSKEVFSPESVLPVPKAGLRKTSNTRKRRKATILTDSPEKNELAKEQEKSKKRKTSQESNGSNAQSAKIGHMNDVTSPGSVEPRDRRAAPRPTPVLLMCNCAHTALGTHCLLNMDSASISSKKKINNYPTT
ncbi:uncharacterized protein LOC128200420 [Galleria mellonella]|uniref:Uncharacterized protein LOC128200420 n=1 Tax=Galleria mellonella TaxID=7137 RepID=A0ABM3MF44_GALME|nr:uncharacterized protein LOC128200420 [Galleria mellonella]